MKRALSLLVLALSLATASAAFAGGEKCAHDAKVAAAKAKKAELAAHGWLGIKTDKDAAGAYRVTAVTPNSPAAQAGFRSGDVLLALNGAPFADKEAVHKAKKGCAVGKQVTYKIRRDGAEKTLTATLAAVPDEVLAQWMEEDARSSQVAQKPN